METPAESLEPAIWSIDPGTPAEELRQRLSHPVVLAGLRDGATAHATVDGQSYEARIDPSRPEVVAVSRVAPSRARPRTRLGRLLARVLAPLAGAFKFLGLLAKAKYVVLVGSMALSVAAYTWLWGWTFALGFVVLLALHELGHVIELRRQGVPASLPAFLPFLGAVISVRQRPATAYQEARVGLAGPLLGTISTIGVGAIYLAVHSLFWRELAYVGFFINAFNLVPAVPFDGGRAMSALNPRVWYAGLTLIMIGALLTLSPMLFLMFFLGLVEVSRRRDRTSDAARTFYATTRTQRLGVAITYATLVAVTSLGALVAYVARPL